VSIIKLCKSFEWTEDIESGENVSSNSERFVWNIVYGSENYILRNMHN